MKSNIITEPFVTADAMDNKIKPLILKWLTKHFGYKDYPHSFRDQWITWNIWDGEISVGFDSRIDEHNKLLSLIKPQYLGTPQAGTGKIVNTDTFYLDLKDLIDIKYPEIIKSSLMRINSHKGGTNGWHSPSDDLFSYTWRIYLDDGTSIIYSNHKEVMDMVKGDFIYDSIIQERAFIKYIELN